MSTSVRSKCVGSSVRLIFSVMTVTVFSALLLVLAGCALSPASGVYHFGRLEQWTRQTIDGTLTFKTFCVFPIGANGFSSDDDMGLKIKKVEIKGQKEYYFVAEVHTRGWIFAKDIVVKFDDKIYQLRDNSPERTVRSGSYVIEVLQFKITPEMLESLKASKIFTAELYRRVVSIDGENLQKVKDFL
jgi:hypothetical protein